MLFHLVYVSAASERPTRDELLGILDTSRRNNARDGVTGMLLYSGGTYMQVLEGEPDVLDRTYARISGDTRHTVGEVLLRDPQQERSFPEWTMGFADVDDLPEEFRAGVTPLLRASALAKEPAPQRAHKLMRAFMSIAAMDLR